MITMNFVNCHFKKTFKDIFSKNISTILKKYNENFAMVRVVFSDVNRSSTIKVNLLGARTSYNVVAHAPTPSLASEKLLEKLSSLLRRSAYHKHQRKHVLPEDLCDNKRSNGHVLKIHKKTYLQAPENAFDKYEKEFIEDFDRSFAG